MTTGLETILAYHQATKHRFEGYARGPGRMDWATQPDPFRRYAGAPLILLKIDEPGEDPAYDSVFSPSGGIPPAPLELWSISRLLYDSMALSAWKSARGVSWPLRVNPSSGNLHPTECYILCGAVEGLCDVPMVCHYAPGEHALEVRAEIPRKIWERLVEGLPAGTVLLGLTSIHWRESWKYGERAYRYCQLDAGHALGAVALAAAALGWDARLLDDLGSDQLALLLGLADNYAAEAEERRDTEAHLAKDGDTKSLGTFADLLARGVAIAERSVAGAVHRAQLSDRPLVRVACVSVRVRAARTRADASSAAARRRHRPGPAAAAQAVGWCRADQPETVGIAAAVAGKRTISRNRNGSAAPPRACGKRRTPLPGGPPLPPRSSRCVWMPPRWAIRPAG